MIYFLSGTLHHLLSILLLNHLHGVIHLPVTLLAVETWVVPSPFRLPPSCSPDIWAEQRTILLRWLAFFLDIWLLSHSAVLSANALNSENQRKEINLIQSLFQYYYYCIPPQFFQKEKIGQRQRHYKKKKKDRLPRMLSKKNNVLNSSSTFVAALLVLVQNFDLIFLSFLI